MIIKLKNTNIKFDKFDHLKEKIKMNIHIYNLPKKKNYIKKKLKWKIKERMKKKRKNNLVIF